MKRFKTFGIQKIASSARNFRHLSMKIAIYNRCELREWHMKENQQGQFHASRVETACILPSLWKSGVNMARFKVFGNQKFASSSGW